MLAEWSPHIAIVDMDHDESLALLHRLGASNTLKPSGTPILGLTRRGDLQTKLRAFDLGVDDIVTTPFSPEELLARSVVIGRRARARTPDRADHHHRRGRDRHPPARGSDRPVCRPSDSIEQNLLYVLASRAGQVVTREEILDGVWGTDFVAESNIIDRHIRSLRIKLQNDYRHPRFIATVPGKGYQFVPTFSNEGWVTGLPRGGA